MSASLVEIAVATLLGGGLFQAVRALLTLPTDRDLSIAGAYSKLVGDLRSRISDLEQDLAEERRRCDEQIAELRGRITALEARA